MISRWERSPALWLGVSYLSVASQWDPVPHAPGSSPRAEQKDLPVGREASPEARLFCHQASTARSPPLLPLALHPAPHTPGL